MNEFDLNTFIEDLASHKPAPGGGGAAALVGALASCLGIMVGNLTLGKEKYKMFEEDILSSMDKLSELKDELIDDIELDEQCFLPLAEAYKLPKNTQNEIEYKEKILEEALVTACQGPFKIMYDIASVVEELEVIECYGSKNAYSDVGVAAILAEAAINSASLNVYINAKSMKDKISSTMYMTQSIDLVKNVSDKCDIIFNKVRDSYIKA